MLKPEVGSWATGTAEEVEEEEEEEEVEAEEEEEEEEEQYLVEGPDVVVLVAVDSDDCSISLIAASIGEVQGRNSNAGEKGVNGRNEKAGN